MKLLIVESPSKCKTISHYLGEDYTVEASVGHIRDLSIKGKGGFGVDIENHFQPEYVILKDHKEVVDKLTKLASEAEHVYLATDPDREGEAISWHLSEVLAQPSEKVSRIVFNEVTKTAVTKAIENDRQIDLNLVKSQESRRILDRIIGFRLSSLLQQKIGSKSAGRVQSAVLKLLVDREKEINAFDKVEYWDITACFDKEEQETLYHLKAKLVGTKNEKITVSNAEEANAIEEKLAQGKYVIDAITKKNRTRVSKPPFITSTLQQDAGVKFGFNAKRVMMVAQKLYEGIQLKSERVGLITYMRTDSIRLSDEFIASAKSYIENNYGEKYYKGNKAKVQKSLNIQDAHEGIRPTDVTRTPDSIKKYLTVDEYKIYSLIYRRALASLMSDAIIEDTKVDIVNGDYVFSLTGQRTIYDGFLSIYQESSIDAEEEVKSLPDLQENEEMNLVELLKEQKYTLPPARFTEARLIHKMEELGIGRPSTYAIMMETLKIRSYVTLEKRALTPTEQGILTSDQLQQFFSSIINVQYTAQMETTLDKIAVGEAIWYDELQKFYDAFVPLLENARDNMVKIYPKKTDEFCPVCGLPLFVRRGPFGEFTACSGYPHCKFIKKTPKPAPVSTGVTCPVCKEGEIVERTSNRGRSKGSLFYACSRFPKCRATFSGIPTGEYCEVCKSPMINVNGEVRCNNLHCKTNAELLKKEREALKKAKELEKVDL
jgi:DNA topoisomerase-1